jgi:hypothetical protein
LLREQECVVACGPVFRSEVLPQCSVSVDAEEKRLNRQGAKVAKGRGGGDFGFWILDFGFWILDFRFFLQEVTELVNVPDAGFFTSMSDVVRSMFNVHGGR